MSAKAQAVGTATIMVPATKKMINSADTAVDDHLMSMVKLNPNIKLLRVRSLQATLLIFNHHVFIYLTKF